MTILFYDLLLRPLYNILLAFLSIFSGDLWLAIIALTVVVRLIVAWLTPSPSAMQQQMWDLQPKIQEIQEKYKDDQAKQSQEMMNLLKTQWWGPLKWCLGMLLQMPVFLWLYAVVANIINSNTMANRMKFSQSFDAMTYSFLHTSVQTYIDPANLNNLFLWVMNVAATNNIWLAIAAWALMHVNMKIMTWVKPATPTTVVPGQPDMSQMMWFMNIFLVVMMAGFVYSMPVSIGLYVVTSTLIGVLILIYQNKTLIRLKLWM